MSGKVDEYQDVKKRGLNWKGSLLKTSFVNGKAAVSSEYRRSSQGVGSRWGEVD